MMVYCGVLYRGVVGPKTAILDGQNIFFIFPAFAKFNTWNNEFIFKSHAKAGFFSAVAESKAAIK